MSKVNKLFAYPFQVAQNAFESRANFKLTLDDNLVELSTFMDV